MKIKTILLLAFIVLFSIPASAQNQKSFGKTVPIRISKRQIQVWDSVAHKERYLTDPDGLDKFLPKNKIEISAITPYYKNPSNEVIWEGKTLSLNDEKMEIEFPIKLINDSTLSLFYTYHYKITKKSLKHTGNSGWEITSSTEELKPSSNVFPFHVESIPGKAKLYYIDFAAWADDKSILKRLFNEEDKLVNLKMNKDSAQIIRELKKHVDPAGYPTATDIYVIETNYMLFVKWGDKVKVTKMVPSRNVKGRNSKLVTL